MRHRLAIAALALLLATPALPQSSVPGESSPPTPSASAPGSPQTKPAPIPYADPEGVPACRQVCTPTACQAGQVCAPFCYQECM
jgi:hypothetical protein